MSFDFTGKAALVTGAGGGLGRAIAVGLAKGGASVAVVDLNEGGLRETATMVEAAGGRAYVHPADISQKPNCEAAIAAAVQAFGRLDTLVNNAGIISFNPLENIAEADWRKIFAVNVDGPFFLIQAAMPHLLEAQGSVVNICSTAAFIGEAYLIPYCATKSALLSMTKSLAMELMHKPVRVNAVAPGGIVTPMAANSNIAFEPDMSLMQRYMPLRGSSQPEDIAEVALFLASDHARSVHGACYVVDKGAIAG